MKVKTMKWSRPILIFTFLLILAPHFAIAQSTTSGADITEVLFSEVEKQIMQRYFGVDSSRSRESAQDNSNTKSKGKAGKAKKGKKKRLPPGLAKRKELPPGLAKRNSLPPGLAKRDLPERLVKQLPEPRPGTERVIIEGSVVLIEKATRKVLDILENIVLDDN
jgi:hypothetical protein